MSYPADADEYRQAQIDALLTHPVPEPFERLAIFGNGLDLCIGVPSSYRHFKEFLESTTFAPADNDLELADIYDRVDEIAGPEWQDFEAGLGELRLPHELADLAYPDVGDLSELDKLTQVGSEYADTFRTRLSECFTDWIHALPQPDLLTAVPRGPRSLIDEVDGIVVFNYTRTLEETFFVPPAKVLHVHGVVDGPAELYFGCPPPTEPLDGGGSYSVSQAARTAALEDLVAGLTKVPRVELLDGFMINCRRLRTVGSFGFSYGEADHAYVGEVIRFCDAATVWTAHCHTPEDADTAGEVLRSLGFPGTIESA